MSLEQPNTIEKAELWYREHQAQSKSELDSKGFVSFDFFLQGENESVEVVHFLVYYLARLFKADGYFTMTTPIQINGSQGGYSLFVSKNPISWDLSLPPA